MPIYVFLWQAMEEDFHPSYDCSDCAKKAAEDVPENGNAKKKPKMYPGETLGICGLPKPCITGKAIITIGILGDLYQPNH